MIINIFFNRINSVSFSSLFFCEHQLPTMSQGTLYIFGKSPRSNWLPLFCQDLGLDLDIKDIKEDPETVKDFPLSKGPALKMASGFKLTETIAIVQYLTAFANSKLSGSSIEEKALIAQWCSFINSDVSTSGYAYLFHSKTEEDKKSNLDKFVFYANYMDQHLKETNFLTGEEYRSCDVFAAHNMKYFLGVTGLTAKYENISRWLNEMKEVSPAIKNLATA